jgi:N-acetylglucosamine repressor
MKTIHSKVQPALLRQLNERQVLAAIQAFGPLSRADITRHTGISGPTVTRAVANLLEAHFIEEEGPPQQASIGRPGKMLRLARKHVSVLGLVVGTTTCEVLAAGLDGEIEADQSHQFPTPERYEDLVHTSVTQARELMEARKTAMLGLGISVPGLLNRREGRSLFSPNLRQLDGRNLGADLRDRLQMDTAVLQECHALCLAEQVYGSARGVADFAMLDISEGLGLGVMHGGRIVQGHSGFAGELGHITVDLHGRQCGCGNHGCLETVATDAALERAVSEKIGRTVTIDEIATQLGQGGWQIDDELEQTTQYLAVGVAAVINIFNPHKLFIYGRFLDARAGLFERMLELVGQRALAPNRADCEIVRAQGSKRAGVIAAAIQGATTGWENLLGNGEWAVAKGQ